MRTLLFKISPVVAALLASACIKGPGLFKQQGSQDDVTLAMLATESGDGVVTAAYNPNMFVAQTLKAAASSELAGSSVTFPPGSLAFSTNISLEPGSSFVGATTASELGLSNVQASSSAIAITSSTSADATSPFTVNLSMSGLGLRLTDTTTKIAIFYYIDRVADGKKFLGVIPPADVTRSGDTLSFRTKYFGIYQAATITEDVKEVKEVVATQTVTTKAQEKQLAVVTWKIGKPSFDSALNEVSTPFDVQGLGELQKCSMAVFDNPRNAPIFMESSSDKDDLRERVAHYTPRRAGTYSLYFVLECVDITGRFSRSAMSEGVQVVVTDAMIASSQNNTGSQGGTGVLQEPVNVNAIAHSSYSIHLKWDSPSGGAAGFRVSAGGSSNVGCTGPVQELPGAPPGAPMFAVVRDLAPNTNYTFRICTRNAQGYHSGGFVINRTTKPDMSSVCDSGNLSTTCTINTTHTLNAGDTLAGPGSIIIQAGGLINMTNPPDPLIIDLGGDFTMNDGSVMANIHDLTANNVTIGATATIDATGLGRPGGGPTLDGASDPQGPNSGGVGNATAGGGGAHVGNGGSAAAGTAAGGTSFSVSPNVWSAGAGGGGATAVNGGHGGGVLNIRANGAFVMDGIVKASGQIGSGGGPSGAGGGAGGFIVINASTASGTGSIQAMGGSGGSGTNAGGGGGGGFIHLNEMTPGGGNPSCSVLGGSGGSGAGAASGVDGSASGC